MARGLAAAGARVLVTGRSDAKNSDVASEFGTEHVISLDVRDEPAVERAITEIAGRFGGLANALLAMAKQGPLSSTG